MSALGHFIEEQGIATVAIASIRPQAERTRPPRALWVPFELGRPFGPPSDPAFQTRVIRAALELLERPAGPVLLADFPDDDPREMPDPDWRPPPVRVAHANVADAFEAEIAELGPLYNHARSARGRTTVGLTGLLPVEAARYVAGWLRGKPPESPVPELSPILCLRFAVDDVKAFALEAAMPVGSKPASAQLADWFWNDSATGAAVRQLRGMLLASEDERAKLIGTMFLVPGARQ